MEGWEEGGSRFRTLTGCNIGKTRPLVPMKANHTSVKCPSQQEDLKCGIGRRHEPRLARTINAIQIHILLSKTDNSSTNNNNPAT